MVGCIASSAVFVASPTKDIAAAIHRLSTRSMTTLTSSWKDARGVTHSVSTTQAVGEPIETTLARHQAAVEAAQRAYPPV